MILGDKMKKIVLTLLIIFTLTCLIGCGSENTNSESKSNNNTFTDEELKQNYYYVYKMHEEFLNRFKSSVGKIDEKKIFNKSDNIVIEYINNSIKASETYDKKTQEIIKFFIQTPNYEKKVENMFTAVIMGMCYSNFSFDDSFNNVKEFLKEEENTQVINRCNISKQKVDDIIIYTMLYK